MDSQKKNAWDQPFFAQFLEDQEVAKAQGGADKATMNYPSDKDEEYQTMKYPSDGDEAGIELP